MITKIQSNAMKHRSSFLSAVPLATLMALVVFSEGQSSEPGYTPPVPCYPVNIMSCDWHDATRNRAIPVKLYFPKSDKNQFPVIIFSHGLGASRDSHGWLGKHWAGCGYISVHPQHHGSDELVWKEAGILNAASALKESISEKNAIDRVEDVSFVIDELIKLNTNPDSPLFGRIDVQSIGVAGCSFGGWTALAAAGQRSGPSELILTESRAKAAIAISAPVPERDSERAFAGINIPVFLMTGTLDDSPLGETAASQRRIIFDKMTNPEAYLVTFNGADHFSLAGGPRINTFTKEIADGSTAFWDAYLRRNAAAKDWLNTGGYKQSVGVKGVFETKLPSKN
ncbi:acetylhydrolase [soil metagenome]